MPEAWASTQREFRERGAPAPVRPAALWALLALAAGLALSALVAWAHHASLAAADRLREDRQIERATDAVRAQLENCGLLVRSVQSLFLASQQVTAEEFDRIYANLRPREQFPSLQAMAVAMPEARADGLHYPTRLVAPRAGNERLYGLDIATQAPNLAALQRSLDRDQPVMSAAFRLVQLEGRAGPSDGITLRVPLFSPGPVPASTRERHQRFVGSLAISFRVSTLIGLAMPEDVRERFRIRVTDEAAGSRLLYASDPPGVAADDGRWPTHRADIRFGGRLWRITLTARPEAPALLAGPLLTFGIGAVASVLLAFLVWTLATTRSRALALARRWSAQAADSEARFRALNELLPALVLLADARDGHLAYANHVARERLGLPDPEHSGLRLDDLFEGAELSAQLADVAAAGWAIIKLPVQLRTEEDVPPCWALLSVSRIELDGQPHLLAVASDITELRELNARLAYQASHDALTGLINRSEFEARLRAAQPAAGRVLALLYLDLDQFKVVNDTAGHRAGDDLLARLATLLALQLDEGDQLARLGGDEFALLVVRDSLADVERFAERVRQAVADVDFAWDGRPYAISASIGVVPLLGPELGADELMAIADTVCYMAKERGRNRAHVYSDQDEAIVRRRLELEWASRLRKALREDRFELHYQELAPLRDADGTDGAHVELLIRLRDDDGTMVSPGTFIPAAERFGLMPLLDRWVVATALANFDRLHPAGAGLRLCAINLSALSAEDDGFADFVEERLRASGVAPGRVCFEITETAAAAGLAQVVTLMQRLRGIGCHFALDDFGAGMASFAYLKNLPIDYIKIDGSFIRGIENDAANRAIVAAITGIGHEFGLKVVAEWVSEPGEIALLRAIGVDYAQGFAFHRPVRALPR